MRFSKRGLLKGSAAAATAIAATPYVGHAANYPTQRITIINPFAPGSISDASARLLAQSIQDQFGQPVIVENKVGGGGLASAVAVARAAPDGYTLLATASSLFSGAALYKELPIDPIKDFTHVARVGSFPSFVASRSDLSVKSMRELLDYAKTNPGKLTYGHGNNVGQIVGEILKLRTSADIRRVPYRSNPAAMTDLIAGQIDLMMPDLNTGMPHVLSGKARALAVFTKTRCPELPDVPTLDETVMPGFEITPWGGLSGPPKLPADITERLEGAVRKTLQDSNTLQLFKRSGIETFWGGHHEFTGYVASQLANWTNLIAEAGIKAE